MGSSGLVLSGIYFLAARGEDRRTENLRGQLPSGGKNALCVSEEMIDVYVAQHASLFSLQAAELSFPTLSEKEGSVITLAETQTNRHSDTVLLSQLRGKE